MLWRKTTDQVYIVFHSTLSYRNNRRDFGNLWKFINLPLKFVPPSQTSTLFRVSCLGHPGSFCEFLFMGNSHFRH
jgi:hypothetical protein